MTTAQCARSTCVSLGKTTAMEYVRCNQYELSYYTNTNDMGGAGHSACCSWGQNLHATHTMLEIQAILSYIPITMAASLHVRGALRTTV